MRDEEPTLLDRVEDFLIRMDISATRFGIAAVNAPSLVARMRGGKGLHPATVARIERYLAECRHLKPRQHGVRSRPTRGEWVASRYRKAAKANQEAEMAEHQRRAACPIEQAALYLRRRGWMVCRAAIYEPGVDGWVVGAMRKTDEELMSFAEFRGWDKPK